MNAKITLQRMIITFVLVVLLGLSTIGYWVYLSFQQLQNDTETQITTALHQASITLGMFFQGTERLLAEYQYWDGQPLAVLQDELQRDIIVQSTLSEIRLFTLDYAPVGEIQIPLNENSLELFASTQEQDQSLIGLPYEHDGNWYADIVSRLVDDTGETAAFVRVTFDVEIVLGWWDELNLPEESATALVKEDGTLWLRLPFSTDLVGRDITTGPLMTAINENKSDQMSGITRFYAVNTDNVERFVGWQYQEHFNLILASGVSTNFVWQLWQTRYLPGLFLGVSLLVASGVIILSNGRWTVQSERKLTRYADRLNILHQLDQAILGVESISTIGLTALKKIQLLVWFDHAAVTLYDFPKQELRIIAQHTAPGISLIEPINTPFSSLINEGRDSVMAGRTRYIHDIRRIKEQKLILAELLKRDLRSVITIPMLVGDDFVGTLTLSSKQPAGFSPEHMQISREIADQIAIALRQAKLSEEIRTQNQLLEQRVAERTAELRAANKQLRSLDQLKSQFIADVSHELRTPLAGLNTRIHLMERDKPERIPVHLDSLKRRVLQLNKLVEYVLDISRLDLTQEQIAFSKVDLNRIVTSTVEVHEVLAQVEGLTIERLLAHDLPPIWAEENQISQVISNLLANAIYYTPSGTITIRTFAADEVCAGLSITDTGMGIPAEDIPYLFDRFFRGTAISQGNIPGTGLGLSIVKQIIDLHQGSITVESEVGKGSTFTVYFKYAVA